MPPVSVFKILTGRVPGKAFWSSTTASRVRESPAQSRRTLTARRRRPGVVARRCVITWWRIVVAWRPVIRRRWSVIWRSGDSTHRRGCDRGGARDNCAGGDKRQREQARAAPPPPSIVQAPRRCLGTRQDYRARHYEAHRRNTSKTHCSNSRIARVPSGAVHHFGIYGATRKNMPASSLGARSAGRALMTLDVWVPAAARSSGHIRPSLIPIWAWATSHDHHVSARQEKNHG
jgi:hypothetical protein